MSSSLLSALLLFFTFSLAHPPTLYSTKPPPYSESSCNTHNIGYDPIAAADRAKELSTHSWEYGTLAEALLELYTPSLAVYSRTAFPNRHLPKPDPNKIPSLIYAKQHIRLNAPTLIDGDGATGDPASLGVSALLIGQTIPSYTKAANRQFEFLENPATTPRIPGYSFPTLGEPMSHREAYPAAWADFIAMAPPFLAYHAVATNNDTHLRLALAQCLLYRQILKPNDTSPPAWRHILSSNTTETDLGRWSTGNGWVVLGMARLLATLIHWKDVQNGDDESPIVAAGDLFSWIGEIFEAARRYPRGRNGLLRNYWDQEGWEGEISGTAAVSAAVYRVKVLQEEVEVVFDRSGSNYTRPVTPEILHWADQNRHILAAHVDERGIGAPAVNPLDWKSRQYIHEGSPEGQSFLVMLYAAWRDCLIAGQCRE